jgi:hypothetical protein
VERWPPLRFQLVLDADGRPVDRRPVTVAGADRDEAAWPQNRSGRGWQGAERPRDASGDRADELRLWPSFYRRPDPRVRPGRDPRSHPRVGTVRGQQRVGGGDGEGGRQNVRPTLAPARDQVVEELRRAAPSRRREALKAHLNPWARFPAGSTPARSPARATGPDGTQAPIGDEVMPPIFRSRVNSRPRMTRSLRSGRYDLVRTQ